MVYIVPKTYKCPMSICGYEFTWSIQGAWLSYDNKPFCPKCFGEFLRENVPLAEVVAEEPMEKKPENLNAADFAKAYRNVIEKDDDNSGRT